MVFFIMALACSLIGIIPLAIRKRVVASSTMLVVSIISFWFLFWLSSASIVGPFFGACSWAILVLWIIAAVIDAIAEDKPTWIIAFPVILLILRVVVAPIGSYMFRADDFARIVGPMEERVWTQDIQPKSAKHIRMATKENAIYQAKNSMTRGGNNFGSQFEVLESSMTLQMINGVLWYVVPLDFKDSYGVWSNTKVTPGYIMVSGEDNGQEPILKILPDAQKPRYTPRAYFDNNLERHLRLNGYMNVGLSDYTFEIDDSGKA